MAGHMVNPSTKVEDPTAIRSWVMSSGMGQIFPTFQISDPDFPIHYTTSMALRRRLRAVYS